MQEHFDMAQESANLPILPACDVCRTRKVKCDNRRPRCSPCDSRGIDCVFLDPLQNTKISRAYVYELEEKARILSQQQSTFDEHSPGLVRDHPTGQSCAATDNSSDRRAKILEGSGFSFLRSLFADAEWREDNADLLQNLGKRTQNFETAIEQNPLPSAETAKVVVEYYLSHSHIQSPFLLRQDVQDLYSTVYSPDKKSTSHDLFRIFMILAVGSVVLHRKNPEAQWPHPYGYYLSALQHFDADFLLNGVSAIQDLMLIARFGIYHHTGASVWDISSLCIRMCIEQELHVPSEGRQDLLREHLNRRVFWECYMIDRYSSITLGRPVAIANRDIEVLFPANADDEEVASANGQFANLDEFSAARTSSPAGNNEMSVFFHCLRLRQITSQINSKLCQPTTDKSTPFGNSLLRSGYVYTDLYQILGRLDSWLASSPVFQHPQCLYERHEWYVFICERDRLLAIRHAIDMVPKRSGLPPRDFLLLCHNSAVKVILCFSNMFKQEQITYTRSYFQLLFTAGLSIMFYISATSAFAQPVLQESRLALVSCGELLHDMGAKLPDAVYYVTVFEALHRNVLRKCEPGYRTATQSRRATPIAGEGPSDVVSSSMRAPVYNAEINLPVEDSQQNIYAGDQQQLHSQQQPGFHVSDSDNNPHWTIPGADGILPDLSNVQDPVGRDVLHWAFFDNNTIWNMEAGLGEYAYGDPWAYNNIF